MALEPSEGGHQAVVNPNIMGIGRGAMGSGGGSHSATTAGQVSLGLLGALQQLLPLDILDIRDQLQLELALQLSARASYATKWEDFGRQVIASISLRVMGWIKPGAPYIHLIHTIGVFWEMGTLSPHKDDTIGFLGDFTRMGPPRPMNIPPQNGWRYEERDICVDGLAMNDYYAGLNKRGQFE